MPRASGTTLRGWRRSRGWDVPETARRLRMAAKGAALPAHDSVVRRIRSLEAGEHEISERYELLYAAALAISPDQLRHGPAPPSSDLLRSDERQGTVEPDVADDELAALELARRAEASDAGDCTCERLELAFDDLATAYPATAPAILLPRVRAHLGYVTGLLGGRATLDQHRRLLVSGAWLSLLAATLLIDQHHEPSAEAYLRTAAQLARETGHTEIAAWCAETRAWRAVTQGAYREAVGWSRTAQDIAPHHSSVHIQATAQEGRAWARLGDSRETRAALAAVERLVSPLPAPERPEHHYVYDPPKARVYVATTLAWIHDSAAETASREILTALENPAAGPPSPRRIALARLDLGLALATAGKPDEAATAALGAVRSGRLAPVDQRRVSDIVNAISGSTPEARELAEAIRAEPGDTGPA